VTLLPVDTITINIEHFIISFIININLCILVFLCLFPRFSDCLSQIINSTNINFEEKTFCCFKLMYIIMRVSLPTPLGIGIAFNYGSASRIPLNFELESRILIDKKVLKLRILKGAFLHILNNVFGS